MKRRPKSSAKTGSKPSRYYVLSSPEFPCRWMDRTPRIPGLHWRDGVAFTERVRVPLDGFVLYGQNPDAWDHGPKMPPYFLPNIPVFREDLLAAMRECGANNLDDYDAVIVDPDAKRRKITNYKAVNIIGLVAAADMKRSKAKVHGRRAAGDVDFDELVIDPKKAGGQLIFRMAESTSSILCHERLVEFLAKKGFEDEITFLDASEVAL